MKSLIVNENGGLEVREIPVPEINSKQALVKMICCGICNGTDAKLIHRKFKGFEEDAYPLMLGHEGVGEVVKVGEEVTGYHVGDKVLLPFVDADEKLYPGLGSAWGAFSEYGVVNDYRAFGNGTAPECAYEQTILPEDIDPVDASMIITLREVLSSIKRFGMKANESVAVFGCGPVGLTFIRFMSLLGVHPIIAFDIIPEKLEEAKRAGADYLNMQLDWSKAPYNWTLQFQQFPSKKEEGEATNQIIAWLRCGAITLKDYISDYFRFEDVLEAFEKLEKKEIAKKGIVIF